MLSRTRSRSRATSVAGGHRRNTTRSERTAAITESRRLIFHCQKRRLRDFGSSLCSVALIKSSNSKIRVFDGIHCNGSACQGRASSVSGSMQSSHASGSIECHRLAVSMAPSIVSNSFHVITDPSSRLYSMLHEPCIDFDPPWQATPSLLCVIVSQSGSIRLPLESAYSSGLTSSGIRANRTMLC